METWLTEVVLSPVINITYMIGVLLLCFIVIHESSLDHILHLMPLH